VTNILISTERGRFGTAQLKDYLLVLTF